MRKKYMLIAVLCVSLLAGCGTNDDKTTEMSVKTENTESVDTEENTESVTENENVKTEGTEDVTNSESVDETQEVQSKTQEEVTESEQVQSDEVNTDSQTSSDFYMVATSKSAEEVEAFAADIRNFIIDKDWNALAEEMHYPFTMDGVTLENSSDFLALDLDGKLNQAFVDAIESESCKAMFCNYQGIMMGQGEVWLGDVQNSDGNFELKVFAINGMLGQ